MATHRQRESGTWEFFVKRSKLLARPICLSFETKAEGLNYCGNLERLLDSGIVPPEFADYKGQAQDGEIVTIGEAVHAYMKAVSVPESDKLLLNSILAKKSGVRLSEVDYNWIEGWIAGMKHNEALAPTTIRHYVGALGRCFSWCSRKKVVGMLINPILELPIGYARYSDHDKEGARAQGNNPREDEERDRRISPDEEARIRLILDGEKQEGKQRPLEMKYQGALELLFDLGLESAMRMREMYTLSVGQVDMDKATAFLDKTKNGDRRQVPLTTVAISCLKVYLWQVENSERGMAGFNFDGGRLFPWWNGDQAALKATTAKLSRQFARIFDAAGCGDMHFHDLRHEATSRIFERTTLDPISISRITGHKDPRMLRRYYNTRGSDLADRLW